MLHLSFRSVLVSGCSRINKIDRSSYCEQRCASQASHESTVPTWLVRQPNDGFLPGFHIRIPCRFQKLHITMGSAPSWVLCTLLIQDERRQEVGETAVKPGDFPGCLISGTQLQSRDSERSGSSLVVSTSSHGITGENRASPLKSLAQSLGVRNEKITIHSVVIVRNGFGV